jgi:hypothetical protein
MPFPQFLVVFIMGIAGGACIGLFAATLFAAGGGRD